MRSFKFRLERVLDWYGNQFQLEQARLATAMVSLHAIQHSIARFHAECLSVERDIIGRRDIPGRDFPALGLYRLRARKLEHEFSQELQRREQAMRDQMQRVQEAQRRVRLVEKLRERRQAEHRYLEEKEIETLAAEAFLARWDRTSGPSGASLHSGLPSSGSSNEP
jgi:regulator of protease activity HflC (stomatin/prohibitin superfamily)